MGDQKKVLVVDDSATQRRDLRGIFEKAAYCVFEAEDGMAALAVLRAETGVGAVFVDFNMPTMNGLEFIKRMRELDAYKKTAVFLVTTESAVAHRDEAKALGVVAWIVKPVIPANVVKVLGAVLK